MFGIIVSIILATFSGDSMHGLWKLPMEDPTEMLISERNGVIVALFKMDTKEDIYVHTFLGTVVYKKNNNIELNLRTNEIYNKECKYTFVILASGKLKKNKFYATATLSSILDCPNKKLSIGQESMNGVWKLTKKFKRKDPKKTKI
jgi:hypothetical protein